MLDNNSTANPTLTFDQLQAIDVAQKTLANLQSEITNATKVLKGTKMECDRAVKNQAYNEELLAGLTTQVEAKKKELADLLANHTDTSSKLSALNSEIKTKTTEQTTKTAELNDRESLVKSAEEANISNNKMLSISLQKHLGDIKDFNSKVAKLKEVISQF